MTESAGGHGASGGDGARDIVRHTLATLAYRAGCTGLDQRPPVFEFD